MRLMNIVVVYGEFSIHIGFFRRQKGESDADLQSQVIEPDKYNRLIPVCFDHKMFPANMNFRHTKRCRLTQRLHSPSQPWTQIDQISSHVQWRGSIELCRPFWSAFVDSGHFLVDNRFLVSIACGHTGEKTTDLAQPLLDDNLHMWIPVGPFNAVVVTSTCLGFQWTWGAY